MKNSSNKPNFFIVGAPKCGTTSLYEWLRQHPNVFMPKQKEPKYFAQDLYKKAKKNNSTHFFPITKKQDYLKLFADADNAQAIGEASTYYLYSETAPQSIEAFNPDAKIIIMLRDPVEQIISSYNFSVQKGHESAESLEEALKLETKRRDNPPAKRFPKSYLYQEKASFSEHIDRFRNHFPDNQIKIVLLDDLKENPEETYHAVLEFLGVKKSNFTPEFNQENTSGTPRFRWLNKAIKHPDSPVRKLADMIPKSIATKIRDGLNQFLLDKKDSGVSEATRTKLKKQFKPEVEKLEELTNRDLIDIWGYDKIEK
jgi:hypothetical protein